MGLRLAAWDGTCPEVDDSPQTMSTSVGTWPVPPPWPAIHS